MKKILLTGASGFIGYHVAQHLLQSNYQVIAPVRKISLNKPTVAALKQQGLKVIEGEFYDSTLLSRAARYTFDAIVHLAAIRGEQGYRYKEYRRVNLQGTERLLDFAVKQHIREFIFCSSVGVHGTIPPNQPASVQAPLKADNFYHRSKLEAEKLVQTAHNSNLNTLILRPTVTYGLMDDGFMPRLIHLLKNKRFPLSTCPVKIHLLSVNTLAELVVRVIEKQKLNGKAYIVADREPVLLKSIVELIIDHAQGKQKFSYVTLPLFVFRTGEGLLRFLGNKKWLTSLRLISRDWTYNIADTIADLNYMPQDTMKEILPVIREYLNG